RTVLAELRVPVEHPSQGADLFVERLAAGPSSPEDAYHGRVDVPDRRPAGGPQQQIPGAPIAGRVLGEQADAAAFGGAGQGGLPGDESGRTEGGGSGAAQVLRAHLGPVGQAGLAVAAVFDLGGARSEQRAWVLAEGRHLGDQLLRVPGVVVVA